MDKVDKAIALLRKHEPIGGYHLAYSGGKDSDVCKALADMAEVRYQAYYYNVTIDPPELVRYIRRVHPDVRWINSRYGNLFHRLAERKSMPPTRKMRWCCSEFKGHAIRWNKTIIVGIRAEESPGRAKWDSYSVSNSGDFAVHPILDWTMADIWNFIEDRKLSYCELYDEGWDRLGCVGCPLAGPAQQRLEFERWPKYEKLWKMSISRNWENLHNKLKRNGQFYYHHRFPDAEALWQWWRNPVARVRKKENSQVDNGN